MHVVKDLCSYYGITRGNLCGEFKEANDKCEPIKTLHGMMLRDNERRTANEADRIKASKKKVKNRRSEVERDSVYEGTRDRPPATTPASMLLNLLMAH